MTPTDEPDAARLRRWRLLLGPEAEDGLGGGPGGGVPPRLDGDDAVLDAALAALYEGEAGGGFSYGAPDGDGGGKGKGAGRQRGSGHVARWLGDVRKYFPSDLVSVIQADAIERKGLSALILEPETLKSVKPDLGMVKTLMALRNQIPDSAKEAARAIVRAVVEDIDRRLADDLRRAVVGALNRRAHSPLPSASAVDWRATIGRNLHRYDPELGRIVPERFHFFERGARRHKWTVILDMDQSGSMADSVVYGSIAGCVMAGMAALKTHVVAFDTEVVDLTEQYGNDPVDMLFGVQLGGGTDIEKSVAYCETLISDPARTFFVLLSDLCEGGNLARFYARMEGLKASGVKTMALLALSDEGAPVYDGRVAGRLAAMGIPCLSATPRMLPPLVEGVLKGQDLSALAKELSRTPRT